MKRNRFNSNHLLLRGPNLVTQIAGCLFVGWFSLQCSLKTCLLVVWKIVCTVSTSQSPLSLPWDSKQIRYTTDKRHKRISERRLNLATEGKTVHSSVSCLPLGFNCPHVSVLMNLFFTPLLLLRSKRVDGNGVFTSPT